MDAAKIIVGGNVMIFLRPVLSLCVRVLFLCHVFCLLLLYLVKEYWGRLRGTNGGWC